MSTWPIFDIRLSSLAYGGSAFGRLEDGRAVFVPFALPGELVRARAVEEKTGFVRAELEVVLEPSPQRIQARCRHFGECGGCHYQHMPYSSQLEAKRSILVEQLARIGGIESPEVSPVVHGEPWSYRNHIQFHLCADGRLGFMPRQGAQPFAVQECHLPEEMLAQSWPNLDFEALPEVERIGLRAGQEEDIQIILEGREEGVPEVLVEDFPYSVVHLNAAESVTLVGSNFVFMKILEREFRVSASAFFQVNSAVAGMMVAHVLQALPQGEIDLLLELYSGVGLFSAFLAPRVKRLVAVESSPDSCADFEVNLDEFDNVELYEAPVVMTLQSLNLKPDVILVDPPRAGLERKALDRIIEMAASLLVYVSCDPATLGRDAKRLTRGGYRLQQATPFDMFPQTYHIESISVWSRA
jgi:23S rRNA (uracil1939-C5)-methyltransferase